MTINLMNNYILTLLSLMRMLEKLILEIVICFMFAAQSQGRILLY